MSQFFFPDWKGDPEGWAGNMSWAQKWSNMAQLAEEIDAFAPVLLSDEAAPLPSVVENVSWVRTRAQWGPAASRHWEGRGGEVRPQRASRENELCNAQPKWEISWSSQ